MYTTIVFLSMAVGPLLGGALAAAFGIKAVFLASAFGRLAATGLFVRWIGGDVSETPELRVKPELAPAGSAAS